MPRSTRVFKRMKHVGKFSRKKESKVPVESSNDVSSNDVPTSGNEENHPSSSSKKINFDGYDIYNKDEGLSNEIINIPKLLEAMECLAKCQYCNGKLSLEVLNRYGLASEMKLICVECGLHVIFFNSSKSHTTQNFYDINLRLVYGLRAIGKGPTAGKVLCGIMNLPAPPTKFAPFAEALGIAAEQVFERESNNAISEAVCINNKSSDLCVAIDGSWQKRGHQSLNGVVTCTSVDTGKVLDVAVLSKFCRCKKRFAGKHDASCTANYEGTSGGMEIAGARTIFQRSSEVHKVRYVKYLGDGDSKAYQSVVEMKPYKDVEIEKLECIGHVQKRMGARLRNMKTKMKGEKLADGKGMGGKNRLTDDMILRIQKNYGAAIRRNINNLSSMRREVWAQYFHLLSSNEDPQHGLCPKGENSWCKFRRAEHNGVTYDHRKHTHIAKSVMEAVKTIFQDLSHPHLLEKCLHGKTQNPNESVNHVIWSRLPKTTFVTLPMMKLGVHDAASSFNAGYIVKCHTLQALGMYPGSHCVKSMKSLDCQRVIDSNRKTAVLCKNAQMRRTGLKRKQDQLQEELEGDSPSYAAGLH